MLDLSAAFDTIDHDVLISRLENEIGIKGKVLNWFKSYITGRKQSIAINGVTSTPWELLFGVPQGSVLGPILFIIYMGPLGKILSSLGVGYHFYADDSQIYVTFDIHHVQPAVKKMEDILLIIKSWMATNFLCLNDSKTEMLIIASKSNQLKLNIPSIKLSETEIIPSKTAKNIGFIFDHVMDSKSQIQQTCKSGWHHLRSIGKIRPYLDENSTKILVHSFITSRIDMNNCLLLGLQKNYINRIQILQNAAARLIMRIPKHNHITETLIYLHWLPVKQRIMYKTALMVFKALHHLAPPYICELLTSKQNSLYTLRSNDNNLLDVPQSMSVTYGDRNFRNAAPKLWNSLPSELRSCSDIIIFKKLLKTHLFNMAYNLSH